ncbi:MAG: tRNA pseudouridine(38-40) synthase TruA [Clostridiales bacterium]|nr:tRNA pseudouridine(38-40) synthase TruA [Clostridiales bacterium]
MADCFLVSRHRPSPQDIPAEGKRRFRLTIEFDGTDYAGWQRQENALTVQQVLEETLFRLTGENCRITGSSRTDAGVHALGLVCHFDSATRIPAEKVAFALNALLPPDVRVRESGYAPHGFHARYSACGKVYRYSIANGRHAPAVGRQYCWHVPVPLDEGRMREAAALVIGTHDFSAFAASGSVLRDTRRTIFCCEVRRRETDLFLTVLGDGFLYNMVRILAGTLAEIGMNKREPSAITEAFRTGNRLALGVTAPARGLTLLSALYEGDEKKALAFFTD